MYFPNLSKIFIKFIGTFSTILLCLCFFKVSRNFTATRIFPNIPNTTINFFHFIHNFFNKFFHSFSEILLKFKKSSSTIILDYYFNFSNLHKIFLNFYKTIYLEISSRSFSKRCFNIIQHFLRNLVTIPVKYVIVKLHHNLDFYLFFFFFFLTFSRLFENYLETFFQLFKNVFKLFQRHYI